MARKSYTEEEKAARRNQILTVSLALFEKEGYDGTSMRQVADKCGLSLGVLYYYFKNKEDIVSFLSLQSMEKLKSALSNVFTEEKNTREQFFAMCNALVTYHADYPAFFDRSLQYIQIEQNNVLIPLFLFLTHPI